MSCVEKNLVWEGCVYVLLDAVYACNVRTPVPGTRSWDMLLAVDRSNA